MAIENLKMHLIIAVLIFSMVGFFTIYSQPKKDWYLLGTYQCWSSIELLNVKTRYSSFFQFFLIF